METHSLRAQIRQTESEFSVILADTPNLVEAACSLRYQVYCLERGLEPGRNGIETDEFDRHARHVLLVHRDTGETVGTARVIPSSATRGVHGLPMARVCAPELLNHLPSRTTGEISRFAISKRRRMGCGASAMVRVGLMQGIVRVSLEMGLTHWCAIMELTLLRLLQTSSVYFRGMGSLVEYHGLRQPAWLEIGEVLDRARDEQPTTWTTSRAVACSGTIEWQNLSRPEPLTRGLPIWRAMDIWRICTSAIGQEADALEIVLTA